MQPRKEIGSKPDEQRGREFVAAGEYSPDAMLDLLDVVAYHDSEQRVVGQRGCCSGGCADAKLIEYWGRVICKQSWRECPRVRLRAVVELLRPQLNQKDYILVETPTQTKRGGNIGINKPIQTGQVAQTIIFTQ